MQEAAIKKYMEHFNEPWGLKRTLKLINNRSWEDSKVIFFNTEIDAEAVRRWLPPGVKLKLPARAMFFFAEYKHSCFAYPYNETGTFIHTTYRGKDYYYLLTMMCTDDTAVMIGRELTGLPKKVADIRLNFEPNALSAQVIRRGTTLYDVQGKTTGPVESLNDFKFYEYPVLAVRGIPSLIPAALWQMQMRQQFIEAHTADLTFNVKGTPFDPFNEMGIGQRSLKGYFIRVNLGTPPGQPEPSRPKGMYPLRLISPTWFIKHYAFRSL